MQILVVGGTGFVGTALCRELTHRGHDVTALSRSPDADAPAGVETAMGDVTAYDSVEGAFEGQDAVVNLVALSPLYHPRGGNAMHEVVHVGGTENVVRAAEEHGVERVVQQSALKADTGAATAYLRAKGAAEQVVRDADVAATVLRPSVIFGEGGEFLSFIRRVTTPFVAPFPGGGRKGRVQPIWVEDFAGIAADATTEPEHAGETYELGGPEVFTLREVAERVRNDPLIVPVPMSLTKIAFTLGSAVPGFPFGPDQFEGLRLDNTTTRNDVEAFGVGEETLRTLDEYISEG